MLFQKMQHSIQQLRNKNKKKNVVKAREMLLQAYHRFFDPIRGQRSPHRRHFERNRMKLPQLLFALCIAVDGKRNRTTRYMVPCFNIEISRRLV